MKELSIEEKAKRYDEAIERARKINSGDGVPVPPDWTTCEVIFPELKENEDEKIKEGLIQYFKDFTLNTFAGLDPKKILAWLEKQKEKDILEDAILDGNEDGLIADTIKYKNKQKSADKVKPKFHEGDWAVSNLDGKARQISEVHFDEYNSYYVVNGQSVNLEEYDRLHHLWTIQDAKDGDVLITIYNKHPFIYKGCLDLNHPNSPVGYCGIDSFGKFLISRKKFGNWWTDKKVQPATKEQHDLLFQKMKEAGYEWDSEKKELKKIEQKPTDIRTTGYWNVQEVEQNSAWSEEDEKIVSEVIQNYESGFFPSVIERDRIAKTLKSLKNRVLPQPKQEWSEEDKEILDDIILCGQRHCYLDARAVCWIKSLKERVLPKPAEWSEKDERKIGDIRDAITLDDELEESYKEELYDFLKSLKERYTWKPSDEQMKALQTVYDWYKNNLPQLTGMQSLFNDLSKLKG